MVGLGFVPGYNNSTQGVNADGSVVIGVAQNSVGGPPQAFRWTAASGMVGLGFMPGGIGSNALA
jgi:probable HAF family extracellular repeat protein